MLRINPNSIANTCDSYVSIDLETMGASETLTEYFKDQIAGAIDKHIIKQLNDMYVQIDSRPKNLSLNDTIEFDRYAIPLYVSIDYKDNKTPLIPIVL